MLLKDGSCSDCEGGLDIPPLGEHRIEVPYQVEIHG